MVAILIVLLAPNVIKNLLPIVLVLVHFPKHYGPLITFHLGFLLFNKLWESSIKLLLLLLLFIWWLFIFFLDLEFILTKHRSYFFFHFIQDHIFKLVLRDWHQRLFLLLNEHLVTCLRRLESLLVLLLMTTVDRSFLIYTINRELPASILLCRIALLTSWPISFCETTFSLLWLFFV